MPFGTGGRLSSGQEKIMELTPFAIIMFVFAGAILLYAGVLCGFLTKM